jgi:hypothetical protein
MIETEARARLSDLVAATVFPQLSTEQLDRLLRSARRVDADDHLPSDDTEWAASTVYEADAFVVPTSRNGHTYRVSVAGTSDSTEPTWPTGAGETVVDGTVTWTEASEGQSIWTGTWDFFRAAAEGWRIKAGLVSNRHAFGSNQGNYNPEQLFEHCMRMAGHYEAKGVSSMQLASGAWDGHGHINAAHYEDAV